MYNILKISDTNIRLVPRPFHCLVSVGLQHVKTQMVVRSGNDGTSQLAANAYSMIEDLWQDNLLIVGSEHQYTHR